MPEIYSNKPFKDKEELDRKFLEKEKGIYIGYDHDLWDAIMYLAEQLGMEPAEVVDKALKDGLCSLLDKVTN